MQYLVRVKLIRELLHFIQALQVMPGFLKNSSLYSAFNFIFISKYNWIMDSPIVLDYGAYSVKYGYLADFP